MPITDHYDILYGSTCKNECNEESKHLQQKSQTTSLQKQQISQSMLPKKKIKKIRQKSDDNEFKSYKIHQDTNHIRNSGHWSNQQQKKYHWFLQLHSSHFINKHLRRMDKIFKAMATYIGSRQAEQCRSHHQKKQKKHHNFANILINLRQSHYGTINQKDIVYEMRINLTDPHKRLLTIDQLKNNTIELLLDNNKVNTFDMLQQYQNQQSRIQNVEPNEDKIDLMNQILGDQQPLSFIK